MYTVKNKSHININRVFQSVASLALHPERDVLVSDTTLRDVDGGFAALVVEAVDRLEGEVVKNKSELLL